MNTAVAILLQQYVLAYALTGILARRNTMPKIGYTIASNALQGPSAAILVLRCTLCAPVLRVSQTTDYRLQAMVFQPDFFCFAH